MEQITANIVFQQDGQAMTSSIIVAKEFGKEHKHVLRDIRDLLSKGGAPKIGLTPMFIESSYVNEQNGLTLPMYLITRDGFSLLAMGFTGDKALEFKLKFLKAFNAMGELLSSDEYILMRSQQILQRLNDQLSQKVKMLEGENTFLEQENRILAPKAKYTDDVLMSNEGYTFEQMAKELNFRSTQKFTQVLIEKKICYKRSDTYMLFAEYAGKGYTRPRTAKWIRGDGSVGTKTYTVWTEKGRRFLHEKFNIEMQPVDLTMFNLDLS